MFYLLALLLVLFAQETWPKDPGCSEAAAAKLVSLQGKLHYDPDGEGQWRPANLGDSLCEGSRVRVEELSRASLRLPDGVVLRLDQGTVLTLNGISPDQNILLGLLKGFVHFISRTPRRLEITSPITNAGPEGTEFAISADDDKAALWVYEGKVKVYNAQGSLLLNPGESAQALKGQAPKAQLDIKPEDAVNWTLYYPPLLPYTAAEMAANPSIQQAIGQYRQGHSDEALKHLDNLPESQHSAYFYQVRGAIRLSAGRVELAQADIKALQKLQANSAEAAALQAILALAQNRKDEAYALAKLAVASGPNSATAFSALSYVEQSRFDLDKAQAAGDQAARLAPEDAMMWARKAELELSKGQIETSKTSAQKALALDAGLERSQTVNGFAYLLDMDIKAAKQAFQTAISLDSAAPLPRLGLGLAKIRQGDLAAGREDMEIAAILDPANSLTRSYLGKAYLEEKRNPLAETQFNLAKERDPKDPTPYFYDAILKQTTNRPVEGLHDMQKATELNANRGVYRSKLQLDQDEATRQAGTGRIFNSLGFDDAANRQAMKSLLNDPSNYSAHRLLSDGYVNKPRHEIARSSEFLQSQLLQPLNYNPIQPSLAYSDLNIIRGIGPGGSAFNEYNRLYESNGLRLTSTGIGGSNNTFGDETAVSGILNKFAFGLGQLHYDTDGFRKNNDLKHNIYNAFGQYEFSEKLNLQAEFRHRETEHGDLELKGRVSDFSDKNHRDLDTESYRVGLKYSPAQHSDILFSFTHALRDESLNDVTFLAPVLPLLVIQDQTKHEGEQVESQYIYHHKDFNLLLGGGSYEFDVDKVTSNSYCDLGIALKPSACPSPNPIRHENAQRFGYAYSNISILHDLTATIGLSYENYWDDVKDNEIKLSQLSPKVGLNWQYNPLISFRAAFFQTVKSPIVVNQSLQPTQIAGFNQNFDDLNGTRSTQYGIGMDTRMSPDLVSGLEAYKRELILPNSPQREINGNIIDIINKEEELYRFYLNWLPSQFWAVNTEFRFENYRGKGDDAPLVVETAFLPLHLKFFHPCGFFANLGGTLVDQNVKTIEINRQSFASQFFLVDAAIGYRLPKQYGIISFEAQNLLDNRFKYRDRNFQMNEQRTSEIIPERILLGRVTLNF